jgi:hypothetical protein
MHHLATETLVIFLTDFLIFTCYPIRMKQYKLLQNLPGCVAGTIFTSNGVGDSYKDSQNLT